MSSRENPTEFKAGTSNYFTLAGVGIRDSSREPLAKHLLRLKEKHLGRIAGADWGETEIKGRYLLHVARALKNNGKILAPTGWQQITDRGAFDALIHDLSNALLTFRPLILANVVDKRRMAHRDIQLNPIVWDREIIQLADVAAFLVTKLIEDSEPPSELTALWEAFLPQFARHHKSGRILGRGIAMYPPRSSKLTL